MATNKPSSRDLLRRYLSGAITAPEEAALERLAQDDKALAEAMRGLQSAPEEDHEARVRNMVRAARQGERGGAATVRPRQPRYRWAAVAAILLLIVSSLLLLPKWLDQPQDALAIETSAPKVPATSPLQSDSTNVIPLGENEASATPEAAGTPTPPTTAGPRQQPPQPAPAPKPNQDGGPPPDQQPSRAEQAPSEAVAAPTLMPELDAATEEELLEEVASPEPPPNPAPVIAKKKIVAPTTTTPPTPATRRRAQGQANQPALGTGRVGAALDGRITNENGYPIANALVRLPGLPLGERTDSNGLFLLPADATTSALVISHPDYETEKVDVPTLNESLQISLERKPFQPEDNRPRLSQDISSSTIILDKRPGYALPLEGYNALRKRIEANRPDDVPKGKVKLSFLVNPDGTLTDFQFRGRPSQATMDYIGETLVKTSVWEVVRGEEPVRVYFKVVF